MKKKKLKKKNERLRKIIIELGAENQRLEADIYELVFRPDSMRSYVIKNSMKIQQALENAFFQGEGAEPVLKGFFEIRKD